MRILRRVRAIASEGRNLMGGDEKNEIIGG